MRYFGYRDGGPVALQGEDTAPAWLAARIEALHARIAPTRPPGHADPERPPFPCHFAATARAKGALRYSYLRREELTHPDAFVDAVRAYVREAPSTRALPALLVFVETPEEIVAPAQYESAFWSLLQHLHDADPAPWPSAAPTDPEDPEWQLCFEGAPLFFVGKGPSYRLRESRWFDCLMVLVQTQATLDPVDGFTPEGISIRERIRSAVVQYDGMALSPDLLDVGTPRYRDWRQYWLRDTNHEPSLPRCPLRLRAVRAPGAPGAEVTDGA
jgi:FPC/CPF motif-containing protein YcgG